MIVNLDIEAEPDLCAWLVAELPRRRDALNALGSDASAFTFDDVITSVLWEAYERLAVNQTRTRNTSVYQ